LLNKALETRMSRRILLVEDNEMNRDMLSRRLKRRDFEVSLAVDGGDAIEKANAMPELILLDMSLPVLDGWTVAGRLKREEKTRHIPIIALTAHAMVGDREKALAAGCDDYETKPIDFPRLLAKMDQLLGNS
jgi:two-component system cell cycle response regulator DivK